MSQALTARVSAALKQIVNPRTGEDLVSSEQVANIGVTLEGKVRLELRLASADDATLALEAGASCVTAQPLSVTVTDDDVARFLERGGLTVNPEMPTIRHSSPSR